MKKVSVIIPVYNTSEYIEECLNSVICQTYDNLEIIIINDGSTDDSLEKILKYQALDDRIIVINNENKGVSYSKNIGIKCSTGDYLTFVDSDDIVSSDFILNLVTILEESNSDCSVCGIKSFYANEDITYSKGSIVTYNDQNQMKIGLFHELGGFLANKMYKSSIIEKEKCSLNEDIFISEDLLFNLYYLDSCRSLIYDSTECYFYRQHHTSAYNNLKNNQWLSVLEAYQLMIDKERCNKPIYNEITYYFGLAILEAKYRLKYMKMDEDLVLNLKKLEKEVIPIHRYLNPKYFFYKFFPEIIIFYRQKKMKG